MIFGRDGIVYTHHRDPEKNLTKSKRTKFPYSTSVRSGASVRYMKALKNKRNYDALYN